MAFFSSIISWIYYKIRCLYLHIFCLVCSWIHLRFLKSISNCNNFLSFKGITHAYLLKISIAHNKKWIPLLDFLINCISSRLAPQILSIKDDYTFIFFNFLIIGLYTSSANSLFEIFWFLIPLPANVFARAAEVFFVKKMYKSFKQVRVDIHLISNF